MNQLKVGDLVSFKFGRIPSTTEGRAMTACRPRNMIEMKTMPVYQGEWDDLYASGRIEKLDGQFAMVDGYRLKIDQLKRNIP